MANENHKLSVMEKAGYSLGDGAANFVFMSMILFQANFYTDVFGLSTGAAGLIVLVARLWDAFFDPIMGVLADRTNTRWGRFRPWVLWTSFPWAIVMVLAYTTPDFGEPAKIAWAFITNILLMSLYSANNMPYSALGAVMTADINERAKLNSYRFIVVNICQFLVGGFTLTLVHKFAGADGNIQQGWSYTMGLWALLCLLMFLVTFSSTKERIQPVSQEKTSPKQDFADLFKNSPWKVMFFMTLAHFAMLSFRGGALYNYYHQYADKAALFDWVASLGLTAPALTPGAPAPGGILETLGCIVHGDRSNVAATNAADVAYSLINMLGQAITMIVILLSPPLARRFGKKAVGIVGFGLAGLGSYAFYFLSPTNVIGMVALTALIAICYAPTIPLIWTIYADVADYSEWKNHRRATGIIFATIGFGLKSGLALGASCFLWIMGAYGYQANQNQTPDTLEGIRMCSGTYVGVLFTICTILLMAYQLNKKKTIQISDELAERRQKAAAASPA
jgi:Na+/melibiose symporter-like transporter